MPERIQGNCGLPGLLPDHSRPGGPEDLRAGVRWLIHPWAVPISGTPAALPPRAMVIRAGEFFELILGNKKSVINLLVTADFLGANGPEQAPEGHGNAGSAGSMKAVFYCHSSSIPSGVKKNFHTAGILAHVPAMDPRRATQRFFLNHVQESQGPRHNRPFKE